MANDFTKSETPFLADFTSKTFFFLKNLNWLRSTKYHIKFDFFYCCCPSKHSSWWRRLEDAFKTSSRRLHQDEYVRLSLMSSEDVFKTSWSRPIYSCWPSVFKTSSRHFQDVFKTSCKTSSRRLQDILKTSSRRLQDIFKTSSRRFEDFFKTSSRRPAKISSRRFQDVSSS